MNIISARETVQFIECHIGMRFCVIRSFQQNNNKILYFQKMETASRTFSAADPFDPDDDKQMQLLCRVVAESNNETISEFKNVSLWANFEHSLERIHIIIKLGPIKTNSSTNLGRRRNLYECRTRQARLHCK